MPQPSSPRPKSRYAMDVRLLHDGCSIASPNARAGRAGEVAAGVMFGILSSIDPTLASQRLDREPFRHVLGHEAERFRPQVVQ